MAQAPNLRPREAILVAEDEEDVRLVVSEALAAAGFSVLQAQSGPEALRILETNPDIALLFRTSLCPGE